jgi:intraflagellar transport protein 52
LNHFLKKYGIRFRGDTVVRTSYYKYPHPKECFIESCKVHPEFLRSIKAIANKKKIILNDNLDGDDDIDEDSNLKFVYPYGQSLDVNPNISVVLNSGIITYPINRPLSACTLSENRKGRIFVLGSEKFFEDEYFEKEENKKVTVRCGFI